MSDQVSQQTTTTARAPRVLVAEDSPIQAEMLRRLLVDAGYDVTVTKDGVEALEQISQQHPHIVLSDVNMPRLDGIELCETIKKDESLRDLKLILVTTLADPEEVMRGASAGADDYVVKPYRDEYLLQKVSDELARPHNENTPEKAITTKLTVGKKHYDVVAPPAQLLKLMISTYENASQQNKELIETQVEMKSLNRQLEDRLDEIERTQTELQISEERYRTTVTLLPDIVYRIDPEGRFVYVNDAVQSLGWKPDELIGQHFGVLLDPEDSNRSSRDKVLLAFTGQVTGNQASPKLFDERRTGERTTYGLEIQLMGKSGDAESHSELFPLIGEVNSAGFYIGEDNNTFVGSVGTIRDITQRKQVEQQIKQLNEELEERVDERTRELSLSNQHLEKTLKELNMAQAQMIQSEKMSALGTLVAGVTHELNNPLMGAMNYVDYVKDHADDEKLVNYLEKAQKAIGRATQIVKNMLNFSRVSDEEKQAVGIDQIVDSTLDLVGADFRHRDISVTIEVPDDLPPVLAVASELQQVLLNLFTNARDALDEVEHRELHITADNLGESVRVKVRDTAAGIPEDKLSQIFDPFFTTKPPGKGTGLGLAISANLIRGFGGDLTCESTKGKGTTFYIDLPIEVPTDMTTAS